MSNGIIRIEDLHDSIKVAASDDTQTTTSEVTRLNCLNKNLVSLVITGKTIVNLLGVAGDCEDVSLWGTNASVVTLDSTNRVFGSYGMKVAGITTGGIPYAGLVKTKSSAFPMPFLDNSKYYCISAYLKNGNASSVYIFAEGCNRSSSIITDTTKFTRAFVKLQPSDIASLTTIQLLGAVTANTGQYFYVDGVMIEEISGTDYDNPNWKPSPYVTNDTSVGDTAGRIKSVGKNKIKLVQGSFNESGLPLVNTNLLAHKNGIIPVNPNTTYTISLDKPLLCVIHEFNEARKLFDNNTWSTSAGTNFTITTSPNTKFLGVAFKIDDTTPIYLENYQIQVEEGDTPTAYEPYEEKVMPIPYPLREIKSANIADIQDTKKGKVYKKIEKVILDGNLSWSLYGIGTGYKRVKLTQDIVNAGNSVLYKYNNKQLSVNDSGVTPDSYILFASISPSYANQLFVTIPQADSGWGDSYTPTSQEIQYYFSGFKMYISGQSASNPYNGTGTKAWCYFNGGSRADDSVPPIGLVAPNYTPYRLYYQLAQAQELDLNVSDLVALPEGSLIVENDAQCWVRPTVTYTPNKNSRANLESLMQEVARNNTYKPLNGVYATTQNITYYVDVNKGDDVNHNGLSPDKPFKTIMRAVNSLPQVINHLVNINVAKGTYNEDVVFYGFSGKSAVFLVGGGNTDCIITGTIYIKNNTCEILVKNVNMTVTNYHSILCQASIRVTLYNLKINGVTSTYIGVVGYYCNIYLNGCEISNKLRGINASICSTIMSDINSGTGNTVGLFADYGGTIAKYGMQPGGTTAESTLSGGVIR